MPLAPQPVSRLIFTHFDVADRLRHVTGLADTLAATTVQLMANGDKNPLLTKVSQAPPKARQSRDTAASTLASGTTSGAPASRTARSSTGLIRLDPGARDKKWGSRTTVTQSVSTVGLSVSSTRQLRSASAAGPGKSPQPVSTPHAKHNSTDMAKPTKNFLHSTTSTVPPRGNPAAMQSKNPPASSKSNEQRTRAARELENFLGGDHHVAEASPPPGTEANSSLHSKSSKEKELALARSRVEDTQRAVEDLTSTAAKTKSADDQKRACYIEAHAKALEEAFSQEPTDEESPTSLSDKDAELLRMEYDYRTASAVAKRAMAKATKATNILKTLIRRLAKITPKSSTASELKLPQADAATQNACCDGGKGQEEKSRDH
uniref:Uncharacterized protein n=1 Tax=Hyaloperonospora arabidopsidis (strain Emoy2) TaxID=559515 RepID=M4BB76_HYAAE